MKKENRKYRIVKKWHDQYYNDAITINYKNKTCFLSAGTSDTINVFRYDNNHFFVLTSNYRLDYAGFELIEIDSMEVINDQFFQNITEIEIALQLKQRFFDYTENSQADILAQWIQ